jgi:hypothetical protein
MVIAVLGIQDSERIDETVKGRYEAPNGFVVEGLGGCRIAPPDRIDCWDMEGKPSASVADRVRLALLEGSQELSFRFGRDTQYLVVRRSDSRVYPNYSGRGGRSFNSMSLQRSSEQAPLDLLRVSPEPDARTEEVVISFHNLLPPKTGEAPLTPDAKVKLDNVEFTLGTPSEVKDAPTRTMGMGGMFPQTGRRWRIPVGIENDADGGYAAGVNLLDKAGKPIRFVDLKGEPVPTTRVLAEYPDAENYGFVPPDQKRKYVPAMTSFAPSQVAGAGMLITNVNPARAGRIFFSKPVVRRVLLTGFPVNVETRR